VASRCFSNRRSWCRQVVRWSAAALGLLLAGGCARLRPIPVKPYQRVHLSDRIMRTDVDRLGQAADQHVLSTREGASGGNGTAGGGCGCN
jgi:hypothetical protein